MFRHQNGIIKLHDRPKRCRIVQPLSGYFQRFLDKFFFFLAYGVLTSLYLFNRTKKKFIFIMCKQIYFKTVWEDSSLYHLINVRNFTTPTHREAARSPLEYYQKNVSEQTYAYGLKIIIKKNISTLHTEHSRTPNFCRGNHDSPS